METYCQTAEEKQYRLFHCFSIAAGFWQDRSISLSQNDYAMNRLPLDEMYLLNSLLSIRELSKEEQSRITIFKFEYAPRSDFFTADLTFVYENECSVKTRLSYELAGKRSEDHFFEHVMYENDNDEIEFSNFKEAIEYCNEKQNH